MTWRQDAACVGSYLRAFFPDTTTDQKRRWEMVVAACLICDSCRVAADCFAYAIATGQQYGVWGGMTGPERRRLMADIPTHPNPDADTTMRPL